MSKKSGRRKGTRKRSVADMPARKGPQARGGSLPLRTADNRRELGVTLENVQITSYQLG